MSFIKEFKDFALKGNMLDLAIGVIIGSSFGKLVSSLVTDIIMPPIGFLIGGIDFSKLTIKLSIPGSSVAPVELKYGQFINTVIDFLIIAFIIFLVIKGINRFKKPQKTALTTKLCPKCCMEVPLKAKKCGHCCSIL